MGSSSLFGRTLALATACLPEWFSSLIWGLRFGHGARCLRTCRSSISLPGWSEKRLSSDRARSWSSQQEAENFSKLICKQFSLNTSVNLLGSVIQHWFWAPAFCWQCILAWSHASNTGSQVLKIKLLGWLRVRYSLDPSTAVLESVCTDLQWKLSFNGSLQFFFFFYQKKK